MAASLVHRGLNGRFGSDPDIRDDESRYYCNIEMSDLESAKLNEKEKMEKLNYSVSTKRKKSSPAKLMREESASSDCTEETYLTPNSLKPDQPDETTKIQVEPEDPEIRLAKAIIDGNEEDLDVCLKVFKSEANNCCCLFNNINVQKLQDFYKGSENFGQISPLDLAAQCDRESILDLLIDHGMESNPKFEDQILLQPLRHLGKVFDRLVVKNPNVAKQLLDQKIEEETEFLKFDFSPFYKSPRFPRPPEPETISIVRMLESDRDDLIRHPMTETFIRFKWKKASKVFVASFVYRVFFAVAITVAAIFDSGNNRTINQWNQTSPLSPIALLWLSFALFTPIFFQIIFNGFRKKRNHFFVAGNVFRPDVRSFTDLILAGSIIIYVSVPQNFEARVHFGAWTILFSWISVMLAVGEFPNKFGLFVNVLRLVVVDVLTFFAAIFPILIGFGVVFHLLLPDSEVSQSPVASLFVVLAMLVGHFEPLKSGSIVSEEATAFHGTTQIIFLIFYFTVTISVFNVAIGISMNHIRDALSSLNQFKLVQIIQLTHDIEDSFIFASKILQRIRLLPFFDPSKCIILFNKTDDVIVRCKMMSKHYGDVIKRRDDDVIAWTSKLNDRKFDKKLNVGFVEVLSVGAEETNAVVVGSIPMPLLQNAQRILEERKEREKDKSKETEKKAEEVKPVVNEYTNLYWQPDNYSLSENEYEIVEDNSSRDQCCKTFLCHSGDL